jgi:hypothetical protein
MGVMWNPSNDVRWYEEARERAEQVASQTLVLVVSQFKWRVSDKGESSLDWIVDWDEFCSSTRSGQSLTVTDRHSPRNPGVLRGLCGPPHDCRRLRISYGVRLSSWSGVARRVLSKD